MRRYILWLTIAAGVTLISQGSYMQAKAKLAQWLIEQTWSNRMPGQPPTTPWWWADTHVIAKLGVPALKKTRYVMNSESGQSLAFGPGHLQASPLPGGHGHSVVAGHRDSHFTFLQDVKLGHQITIENYLLQTARYRVVDIQVIDTRRQQIPLFDTDMLSLVTCFPFNGLVAGGPLRYLVLAKKEINLGAKQGRNRSSS